MSLLSGDLGSGINDLGTKRPLPILDIYRTDLKHDSAPNGYLHVTFICYWIVDTKVMCSIKMLWKILRKKINII